MESWMTGVDKTLTLLQRRKTTTYDEAVAAALAAANRIINGDFRINQRGYVSGATLIPGITTGYGHDRWGAGGLTNLIPYPSAENATLGWVTSSVNAALTRQTTVAKFGTYSYRSQCTTATATGIGMFPGTTTAAPYQIPVVAGQTYTFSFWAYTTLSGKWAQPRVRFAAGTSNLGDQTGAQFNLTPGVWTLVTQTVTAPLTATTAAPWANSGEGFAVGNAIYYDGFLFTEGDVVYDYFDGSMPGCLWLGAANASSSINRPALTAYTYVQAPNGCEITIADGASVQQVIERANMPAGAYTASWGGTAQASVRYRGGGEIGSSSTSPLVFETDGSDDVVVEFSAVDGSASLSDVNVVAGGTGSPFRPRHIGAETELALRYFQRLRSAGSNTGGLMLGGGTSATEARFVQQFSPPLRIAPVFVASGTFEIVPGGGNPTDIRLTGAITEQVAVVSAIRNPLTAGTAYYLRGASDPAYLDFIAEF